MRRLFNGLTSLPGEHRSSKCVLRYIISGVGSISESTENKMFAVAAAREYINFLGVSSSLLAFKR